MKTSLPFCRRLITSLFLFTITTSSWAYDFEVDGICYNITSDSTVAVTSGNTKYTNDIVIPEKVTEGSNTYTVTAISTKAFISCYSLISVTIPGSVTSIGDNAFTYSGLTSITIPNSVTSIGKNAFSYSDLTSITIPSSVTRIEDGTFMGCTSLENIELSKGVTSIGSSAFKNCTKLTFIDATSTRKAKVTIVIRKGAFIPNSVTYIGNSAFEGCSSLPSVEIPSKVNRILGNTFKGCSSLTSVIIPGSVTYIGYHAFNGCTKLERMYLYSNQVGSYLKEFDTYDNDCIVYVHEKDVDLARTYWTGELRSLNLPYSVYVRERQANSIKFEIIKTGISGYSQLIFTSIRLEDEEEILHPDDNYIYTISNLEPDSLYRVKIKYQKSGANPIGGYPAITDTLRTGKPKSTLTVVAKNQGRLQFRVNMNSRISTAAYEVGCVLDSTFYKADTDSIVAINKLTPGKQYTITPYVKYNKKTYLGDSRTYTTESIEFYCEDSRTQSSFSVKPRINNSDGTALPDVLGVEFNGTYYSYEEPTWIKITGLTPNNSYSYRPYAEFNGEKIYGSWKSITTRGVSPYIGKTEEGVTTLSIFGRYTLDDATLDKAYFEGYEDQGKELHLSGLTPNTNYSFTFYVKTKEGSIESVTKSFTTSALEWETLPAEATSNTVALICAKTNIADEETGTGFEWRRYDAPDLVPSTKAPCPVVDGVLTGALRNLSANTYYKFRPYYTSAAGQTYYGDWLAFGTADAYVYFDPTVRTYEASTVSHNSAKLKGYAIAGSDDIVEQGFEYRTTGRSTAPLRILATNAEGDDVQSVIATGQWMNVTLENLQPGTTYTYRAYVKTAKATTYGEEQSFTTMEVSGIGDMDISEDVTITAIYTLDGRRIASLQPGVNIVHYSNGSVRKMIVK